MPVFMELLLKRSCIVITGVISCTFPVLAQDMWAYSISNYSGVAGAALNPSSMVTSKLAWDFNLLSFDGGFSNNSFYMNAQSPFSIWSNAQDGVFVNNERNADTQTKSKITLNGNIKTNTFVFGHLNIKGPSYMHSSDRLSFCVFTGIRAMVSAIHLPRTTVKFAFEESAYPPLHNKTNFISNEASIAFMNWGEVGASLAGKLYDRDLFQVDGGITLKYLMGYAGGYMQNYGTEYTMPRNYFLKAQNLNMDIAHAYSGSPTSLQILGNGVGGDVGLTFIKKKHHKSPYYGCPSIIHKSNVGRLYIYKWKLGVSLIDLGMIRFKNKAKLYQYRQESGDWDSINKLSVKSVEDFDRAINEHWSYTSSMNKFNMWLPLAASFQFDYHLEKNFYLNLGMIQRIHNPAFVGPVRMNSITFTPRYETDDVEFSIPISLVEYSRPFIGMMFRYKYFFIGTDQAGSSSGITRLDGFSMYAGIRICQLKSARLQSQPFLGF